MTSPDEENPDPRPRNLEAERAVLGAMLLSARAVGEVLPILSAADFYRPAHATVFATISALFEAGEPTDPVAVAARLARDENLLRVGGAVELHSMCEETPVATSPAYWAELVAGAAARARLVDTSQRLAQLAADPAELPEVLERARTIVDEATRPREDAEAGVWVGDVIDEQMAGWEETQEHGIPWPYMDVDDVTNGMKPGQLIVTAGRPGTGKSTVGMDCARYAAKHGHSVMIASLEMTRGELVMRLACAESGVRLTDVKSRRTTAADKMKLRGSAETIAQMPLRIEDRFGMTLGQLRALAREMARGPHGLDFLVLDYIQLLTPADSRVSRQEQVGGFSRGLKQLTKELHIPILAAAQLNRGPEQRVDKVPVMSDLRESGSLEQDPDMIVLLNRPDAHDRESPRAGEVDLILAKHRAGPTSTITVAHQLHYCRFSNITRDVDPYDRKDIA